MASFQPNSDRFLGLADVYDAARPRVPKVAYEVVLSYLHRPPETIVDIGCGTGLSTRPWLEVAPSAKVTGVDPNPEMLSRARAVSDPSIAFSQGFSHTTGLLTSSVDVASISQAFHWMDPVTTLAEAARILRPGGVLCVIDCAWPPTIPGCWRSEKAFMECRDTFDRLVAERGLAPGVQRWDKTGHLASVRTKAPSGAFEWAREVLLHSEDMGTPERLVALEESQGGVKTGLKGGVTRDEGGLTFLEKTSAEEMGPHPRKWIWGYTIELAFRSAL